MTTLLGVHRGCQWYWDTIDDVKRIKIILDEHDIYRPFTYPSPIITEGGGMPGRTIYWEADSKFELLLFRDCSVEFRHLSDLQLSNYLRVEQPYQCAGSIKSEGYAACLFSKMHGDDPTALVGLPLIRLITMLENAGVSVV